jgi:hypothetical protein
MENMEKQNIQKTEFNEKINLEQKFVPLCHTEEETEENFIKPFLNSLGLDKGSENNV